MHSLVGFGLPSGAMCLYSRPSIQDSLRARRTVPGFSPVTAIRTFSVTHSLGVRRMTSLIPTSHHIQATAVAPRFKHSFNHFTAVKPFYIPRKAVAVSVPLAHPHFESFMHRYCPQITIAAAASATPTTIKASGQLIFYTTFHFFRCPHNAARKG